jgi:hypothetical protein
VLVRFTSTTAVRAGRNRGRMIQRFSSRAWLWPPPASTNNS